MKKKQNKLKIQILTFLKCGDLLFASATTRIMEMYEINLKQIE